MVETVVLDESERVLIVDDDALTTQVLSLVLVRAGHIVVGKVTTGDEAIRQVVRHSPSLLLLDLDMSRLEGLATLRKLQCQFPWLAVLVVSMLDPEIYGFRCMRLGAKGFLNKAAGITLLPEFITQIRHGQTMFPSSGRIPGDALSRLSDAELVVLRCLVRGGDVSNAASTLQITRSRTNVVIRSLQAKLGLKSHGALIDFGRRVCLS
ncbi:response regulator transcription factor [Pseudomonas arsenicoxydans]|uniref:DNA-binding response regulator n=1 Tax=Pseudomonas arsenicoxydans TaxID=702115 RepID=A0A502GTH4_9PSED|nr:response regulator transcription factor [Pseudomonas arsenicoxydans]TPG65697.1 DNA-binding response regulator [Pseudomonas arsenicoxydans]